MVKILNRKGYSVYVDWISDKDDLKRENINGDTANVLKERLRQSHFIIYAHTKNAQNSSWVKWEIEYFNSLKKDIPFIIDLDMSMKNTPEFSLVGWNHLFIKDGICSVKQGSKTTDINDFINNNRR